MLLLAVTRYASHTLDEELKKIPIIHIETESPFRTWWLKKCEQELTKAYKFMSIGVGFFLIDLGVLSWIQYISSTYTSSIISVLALIGFLFWQLRIASRWRYLLHPPSNTPMLANTMYTTTLMTTEQTTTWLNEAAAAAAIEFTQAQNGPQLRRLSIVTTSPQLSPSESKTEYR
jgi:hypothetical protein